MFSPADGGFCGARSCYSDLRLPAALYIENFTIFYHAMQAESYFLFFQKSPPIRNYRQLPDHFVSSPLPLLRCCSVFFLLFFSGFTIFVKNVRCALFPRKLPSLHGIGTFQHGCSKDTIAAVGSLTSTWVTARPGSRPVQWGYHSCPAQCRPLPAKVPGQ